MFEKGKAKNRPIALYCLLLDMSDHLCPSFSGKFNTRESKSVIFTFSICFFFFVHSQQCKLKTSLDYDEHGVQKQPNY